MSMGGTYTHKVDKNIIPTCNILGVNIAAIDMELLLEFTDKYIKELSGDYMCVSNVHTTITSYENANYCAVQNGGIMAIPDGGPLVFLGQKRGYKNMSRTTGPSYLEEILRISIITIKIKYGMPATISVTRHPQRLTFFSNASSSLCLFSSSKD